MCVSFTIALAALCLIYCFFSKSANIRNFKLGYSAMQESSAAIMAALSIFLPMKTILLILSP